MHCLGCDSRPGLMHFNPYTDRQSRIISRHIFDSNSDDVPYIYNPLCIPSGHNIFPAHIADHVCRRVTSSEPAIAHK